MVAVRVQSFPSAGTAGARRERTPPRSRALRPLRAKAAGTASLSVSLPTVMVGVLRFRAQGVYRNRAMLVGLALPMAAGSAAGATLGAALLPFVQTGFLKLLLGGVLAASAAKLARGAGRRPAPAA